ncbi:MAG: HD-GYP domain-containing protein [Solirubrobacterales bacterium]|nr:HD-GYP domain-containing protein [Solirubrobacterales bacterium]
MQRRWPRVIAATMLVAVLPSLVIGSILRGGGAVSVGVSMVAAALGSLAICHLCSLCWERYRGSGDVLFGDLLAWGWARRWLIERRLASTASLFGLDGGQPGGPQVAVGAERRMRLLHRLATDLEASDPYTYGHSRRVARYASLLASNMGLPKASVAKIRASAALHDIGKVLTPREILHKPGRLSDHEFEVVKRHPGDGARMITVQVEDHELASIVRHHHERLDGTGYPDRLAGEQIPLGARIIAVADTFDAITSARPYRSAKPHKAALDILRSEAGTQLDPDAVHAFCSVYFGRRPLAVWALASNLLQRLLLTLPARLANLGATAGAAAATALGTGALLLPVAGPHVSSATTSASATHAAVRTASAGSVPAQGSGATGGASACCRRATVGARSLGQAATRTIPVQSGPGQPQASAPAASQPAVAAGGATGPPVSPSSSDAVSAVRSVVQSALPQAAVTLPSASAGNAPGTSAAAATAGSPSVAAAIKPAPRAPVGAVTSVGGSGGAASPAASAQ